jgi:hypothetical protein
MEVTLVKSILVCTQVNVKASEEKSVVRSNIGGMSDINNWAVEFGQGAKRNRTRGHPVPQGLTTFERELQIILKTICT